MSVTRSNNQEFTRTGPMRVGYIPLLDAAPLIVAQELGFFTKYGLKIKLTQEAGWATIREKIIFHELDAAHSLGALPFVISAGLGCVAHPTISPFVFNLHGNAITLSSRLRERGVTDVHSLKKVVTEDGHKHRFTFGVVFPYSNHAYLLKKWLRSGGIQPDREVQIVVLPPPQMFSNLSSGNIDGYCVGEPWNSQAILSGVGWCPVTSSTLSPSHPEKVLMTRASFAQQHQDEHLALVAGLIEGAIFCDQPSNRDKTIEILCQSHYLDLQPQFLKNSLSGDFYAGYGESLRSTDFILFHRFNTNEPTIDKAARILDQIRGSGALKSTDRLDDSLAEKVFQPQMYHQALQLTKTQYDTKKSKATVLQT